MSLGLFAVSIVYFRGRIETNELALVLRLGSYRHHSPHRVYGHDIVACAFFTGHMLLAMALLENFVRLPPLITVPGWECELTGLDIYAIFRFITRMQNGPAARYIKAGEPPCSATTKQSSYARTLCPPSKASEYQLR